MSQRHKQDWFRPRGYPHFDYKLNKDHRKSITNIVTNPARVASHSFYPFIRYAKIKYKTKFDNETKKTFTDRTGKRQICYAAHLDAQIYSYYSQLLTEKYEVRLNSLGLSDNVVAFRRLYDFTRNEPKCNIHIANDAFNQIKVIGQCRAYAFDIEKFFDSLSPKVLKQRWADLLNEKYLPADHYNLWKSLTNFAFVDREALYEKLNIADGSSIKHLPRLCEPKVFRETVREKHRLIQHQPRGIPQGSPISAVLANIYMLQFDEVIASEIKKRGGSYFRYCDDILLIIPGAVESEDAGVAAFVKDALDQISLSVNKGKTEIAAFNNHGGTVKCESRPIQYLGFLFDGQNIYLRPSSLSRYQRKVKAALSLARRTQKKYNKIRVRKELSPRPLYLKKIYSSYSHVSPKTFPAYGMKARDIMGSDTIRKQLKKMNKFLLRRIAKAR
jgi:hypothetical protein